MARATRHLEKLLQALETDSTREVCQAPSNDLLGPPTSGQSRDRGSSGVADNETSRRSRASLLSSSESEDVSTSSGGDETRYHRQETARLVQQLGDSRVQVATLEAKIVFLTNKLEEQETLDSCYIHRLEDEVVRLEETVKNEMCILERRQSQIEKGVPSMEEQLKTIKDALHDFNVSEPLYMELKAIPEHRKTSREHILIMAYEKCLRDREEIEELRKTRDTSREALTRANDEVQRLMRELQRETVNHATDRRDYELDLCANAARMERLEAEHRDSLVQIEVLIAKGALFDEVQAKLEDLERSNFDEENQKAVLAAALQVAIQEKERVLDSMKEKDHTLDLLSMDKIYLNKEIQRQAEQIKKTEAELGRQQEKLREVKRSRTELYNKFLVDKDSQLVIEQRLQAEIARFEGRKNQEVEQIRKEANSIADEKVRTFREMRDEAMTATEMCRSELRDSRASYDELLLKFRELHRVSDLKEVESRGNLKMANFELDRLKVIHDETNDALVQTRLENEEWAAKVQILEEKANEGKNRPLEELKNELEKQVSDLKEELLYTRAQLVVYQEEKSAQVEAQRKKKEAECEACQRKDAQLDVCQRGKISLSHVPDKEKEAMSSFLKHQYYEVKSSMKRSSVPRHEITREEIPESSRIPCEEKQKVEHSSASKYQGSIECERSKLVSVSLPRSCETRKEKLLPAPKIEVSETHEAKSQGLTQHNQAIEEQLRAVTEEKNRVTNRLLSVQDDIRKLLRARGSVEQLQSLLIEKGVFKGGGNQWKSITTSGSSPKAVKKASPKISP